MAKIQYKTLVNRIIDLSKRLKSEATEENICLLEESVNCRREVIENWEKYTPKERKDLVMLLDAYHTLELDVMKSIELHHIDSLKQLKGV